MRVVVSCGIVAAATCWLACGDAPGGPAPATARDRPDLVLIVIDTLRADHLGSEGYGRPTSPNIDRLAAQGTRFANAFAPSSWTRPSIASLFTSRAPSEHGAVTVDRPLPAALPTLAESLRDAGYQTLGVSANFVHVSRDAGMARGFASWHAFSKPASESDAELLWSAVDARGRQVTRRAPRAGEVNREILKRIPAVRERPLFLYAHYMEPHSPYSPPEAQRLAFARKTSASRPPVVTDETLLDLASRGATLGAAERRWLVDLYDAEIASVDAAIGALLEALDARGIGSNAVVLVTSDHGEELGEHGGWFHAQTLHAESLRVPLVVTGPGVPRGASRSEPVDLLDVPTTLLALAGVAPPPAMRGRVLLGAEPTRDLATRELATRDLVAELHVDPTLEARLRPRRDQIALTRWPWKAIAERDGSVRVYQLERDPAEAASLGVADAPASLDTALRAARARHAVEAPTRPLDESAREGLRALGYAE